MNCRGHLAMAAIICGATTAFGMTIEFSSETKQAAAEVRRYVYVRTGKLAHLKLREQSKSVGAEILVGVWPDPALRGRLTKAQAAALDSTLEPESLFIVVDEKGKTTIGGRSKESALWAAYRYAELLGVRFGPDRDLIPDGKASLPSAPLQLIESPSMETRGLFPYHSGNPQGPEFWNEDGLKLFVGQMAKMRLNTVGMLLHHRGDGSIDSTWVPSWEEPYEVGKAPFGMAQAFPAPLYRSEIASSILKTVQPVTDSDKRKVSDENTKMLSRVFSFGRTLGIDSIMGGFINDDVDYWKRAFAYQKQHGFSPKYVWQHTYENWTYTDPEEEVVKRSIRGINDFLKARDELGLKTKAVMSGWAIGPRKDPLRLHRETAIEAIAAPQMLDIGRAPVDPAYGKMGDRPRWVVPWLEDDFNMIAPQFWVKRTLANLRDGSAMGTTGYLATLWRQRATEPQTMALAQFGWSPDLKASAFWLDYCQAAFGKEAGLEIAREMAKLDGRLPRPTDWKDGWPGGIHFDSRPWDQVAPDYAFIENLERLSAKVVGAESQARYSELIGKLRYMRALGRLRTVIGTDQEEGAAREAVTELLQAASGPGDLGDLIFLNRQLKKGGSQQYSGKRNLIVLTPRTSLTKGESLNLRATLIDKEAPKSATLLWRAFGETNWKTTSGVREGLHGFRFVLDAPQKDFEWVVQVQPSAGEAVSFPVSGVKQPATVVVF